MSKITVVNHVSLDGVMQAPGRADEDPRGGFAHGGWAQAGNDPVMGAVMAEGMGHGNALVDSVTTTTGVLIATYADGHG
jgi:hypothetical protein